MSEPPEASEARALLRPRRLAVQITGFVVGVGLLAWIIHNAVREGQWDRITGASPLLLAALLGCTAVSAALNGTAFWITIHPVKHIGFGDLQRLNLLANMLNYAPVRLGAIGRVLYHLRVDGLALLQVGAWFGLLGYVLVLGVASCVMATIVRFDAPDLLADWLWWALVAGQMVLGGLAIRVFGGLPILGRAAPGLDAMVSDGRSLWGAEVLRLADLGAFTARMAAAAAILDIHLSATELVLLALVALSSSLIPFGRLGFREFCVAAAGQRLNMLASDAVANMNQLALVESAGELLFFLPLGLLMLPWFRRRWRSAEPRVVA